MHQRITQLFKFVTLFLSLLWLEIALTDPVDFTLKDLDGKEVSLSDFSGKWVIVNFWASWCGPCIEEIPELIQFQKKHPEHQVLGINFEKLPLSELMLFTAEHGINYPVLRIGESPLVPFEPLRGLPTTAIVNPGGELDAIHTGSVTVEALSAFLRESTTE